MQKLRLLLGIPEAEECSGLKESSLWERLGYQLVGCAQTGTELLTKIEETDAEVIITDILFPDLSGKGLLEEIRRISARIKILIRSACRDFEMVRSIIRYDVEAYILKTEFTQEISGRLLSIREMSEKKETMTRGNMPAAPESTAGRPDTDPDCATRRLPDCKTTANQSDIDTPAKTDDATRLLVERAKEFIRQNYQNPQLSVEMVCNHLHISRNYFSTIFRRETGSTYVAWLTELRMKKAMQLLKESGQKGYLVAEQVGYSDPSYFSYLFKKKCGFTLREYAAM